MRNFSKECKKRIEKCKELKKKNIYILEKHPETNKKRFLPSSVK